MNLNYNERHETPEMKFYYNEHTRKVQEVLDLAGLENLFGKTLK